MRTDSPDGREARGRTFSHDRRIQPYTYTAVLAAAGIIKTPAQLKLRCHARSRRVAYQAADPMSRLRSSRLFHVLKPMLVERYRLHTLGSLTCLVYTYLWLYGCPCQVAHELAKAGDRVVAVIDDLPFPFRLPSY